MSHIVTIETQVRDQHALAAACQRLQVPEPVLRSAQLFSDQVHGHCVQLPDWTYPVVFDVEQGCIRYDNYEGRWGDPKHLDALLQAYAVEKTKLEARRRGHSVLEEQLSDGSIKLLIQLGGQT